jgi:hypothetical protein
LFERGINFNIKHLSLLVRDILSYYSSLPGPEQRKSLLDRVAYPDPEEEGIRYAILSKNFQLVMDTLSVLPPFGLSSTPRSLRLEDQGRD